MVKKLLSKLGSLSNHSKSSNHSRGSSSNKSNKKDKGGSKHRTSSHHSRSSFDDDIHSIDEDAEFAGPSKDFDVTDDDDESNNAPKKPASVVAIVPPPPPFVEIHKFDPETIDEGEDAPLKWYCAPDCWTEQSKGSSRKLNEKEGQGGWWDCMQNELTMGAPAVKDFWRKTYYQPLMVKDDGPFLYTSVPMEEFPCTVETSFTMTPKCQFDQAGIMIRMDHEHWIKTGLEYVDGEPRLSCVTTNSFSDWSTQPWSMTESNPAECTLRIRVSLFPQHGGSFVVEACPYVEDQAEKDKKWTFVRICHLHRDLKQDLLNDAPEVKDAYQGIAAHPECVLAGVFAACPVDQQSSNVIFHEISIRKGSSFVH